MRHVRVRVVAILRQQAMVHAVGVAHAARAWRLAPPSLPTSSPVPTPAYR
jgi:hypothetical protein